MITVVAIFFITNCNKVLVIRFGPAKEVGLNLD